MQDALLIKQHGRTAVLRPADIQWISAEGDYVEINSSGRKFLLRDRISRIEREFAPGEFLRIHRSLLVNRMNIKEFQDRPFGECDVILDDGTILSMARSRKTSVMRLLREKPGAAINGYPVLHVAMVVTILLALQWSAGFAQADPGETLVTTERAFAAMSAASSSDSAFATFIAPEGVLLRPDPVPGAAWLRAHPSPSLMLRWKPAYAVVSAGADLGFTTGPFEDWDAGDTSGTRYHGEFMTAWKRQADGGWKFVLDFGISHQADTWGEPVTVKLLEPPSLPGGYFDTTGTRAYLLHNAEPSPESLPEAVQLLRPGALRILGSASVAAQLTKEAGRVVRTPLSADVAVSGDLAYTYGTFELRTTGLPAQRGYYFTVWSRKGPEAWSVLWDVLGRAR
jgi:ketosteroid isomerase-like protein